MQLKTLFFSIITIVIFTTGKISYAQSNDSIPFERSLDSLKTNEFQVKSDTLDYSVLADTNQLEGQKSLQAQVEILTSIDSSRVQYFLKEIDSLSLGAIHDYDTILDRFTDYAPRKPNPHFYETLGNIGLPAKSKIFDINDQISFDLRTDYFSDNLYSFEGTKYYQIHNPYSQIKYVSGGQKEQLFRVIHSQNFFKQRLNLGIDFRYMHSPGLYNRSFADDKNLSINGQYTSLNKRYGIIANYVHNKLQWQESGGLDNIAEFSDSTQNTNNRRIPIVNLANATNTVRAASIFVNQYFNIGGSPETVKDSTGQEKQIRKFNFGRITHELLYERNSYVYKDDNPTSAFYKPFAIPINPLITYDSIYLYKLSNEINWSNLNYEEKPEDKSIYFYAGVRHEYDEIAGFSSKRSYSQIMPKSGFALKFLKSFFLNVDAAYVIGDYNEDNYFIESNLTQYLGTKIKNIGQLNFFAKIAHYSPSWFFQEYHSNNFDWKNNFDIQESLKLKAEYKIKGISAGIDISRFSNYTYLDEKVTPQQYTEGLSLIKIYLKEKINFGKVTLDSYFVYQKPSEEKIIRVPDFIGNVSIYGTFKIFQDVATLQPGFEVTYNTAYYADKYMPALRSFYLQNEMKIGDYPYVDIFLQLKLKRVRFFVKYDHINALLKNYRYYGTPDYPYQDSALKFGFSWIFHN